MKHDFPEEPRFPIPTPSRHACEKRPDHAGNRPFLDREKSDSRGGAENAEEEGMKRKKTEIERLNP